MRLIIFGPPGSGKGTYSSRISPKLKVAHIATGDIFREIAKSKKPLGQKIAELISKGELIPDDITIKIIKERIARQDCENGFLLDGYPRTIPQAKSLDKIIKINGIINLVVPEKVIIQRLSTRRICKNCGSVFNILTLKPKKEGICDNCGGKLYQRKDDTPKVIKERLKIYLEQTEPLINYYKNKIPFANIECERVDIPPEIIVEKILKKLEKLK